MRHSWREGGSGRRVGPSKLLTRVRSPSPAHRSRFRRLAPGFAATACALRVPEASKGPVHARHTPSGGAAQAGPHVAIGRPTDPPTDVESNDRTSRQTIRRGGATGAFDPGACSSPTRISCWPGRRVGAFVVAPRGSCRHRGGGVSTCAITERMRTRHSMSTGFRSSNSGEGGYSSPLILRSGHRADTRADKPALAMGCPWLSTRLVRCGTRALLVDPGGPREIRSLFKVLRGEF